MSSSGNANTENLQKIENYIINNPSCKTNKTLTVLLQGENKELEVYRLPLDLLFFNIRNGRFGAEYIELKKKEKRELQSENAVDAKKIQDLLIDLNRKESNNLMDDLQKYGQRDSGIITHDGYVINGNRRMAALKTLVDNGQDNFRYMLVARLPAKVSQIDLWKIEAGIQLSRKVQLDYSPINILLKFKEGIASGLTPVQIASSLYGGYTEEEIKENLEQLKLIAKYTAFIGEEGNFKAAEGVNEHFIDLRGILKKAKNQGRPPEELQAIERIGFQLIFDGVPQRELRKIADILRHEKVTKDLFGAIQYSKPESIDEKLKKREEARSKDVLTPARDVFVNCLDSVKAADEAEEPTKLLNRAITNLESINPDNSSLKTEESRRLIDKVFELIEKLKLNRQ